jgi:uncharacterized membrane-anchored protein
MKVDIVVSPEKADSQIQAAASIIDGFSFLPGERYAEYHTGDRIAAYGLTALIAGGIGAAVVKSGILTGVFKALGKMFIFIAVAIVAFLRRILDAIKSVFRKKEPTATG